MAMVTMWPSCIREWQAAFKPIGKSCCRRYLHNEDLVCAQIRKPNIFVDVLAFHEMALLTAS
jgi:hypothetical protein